LSSETVALTVIATACVFSCYFSACHIALKTFSRNRLENLLEARGQSQRFAALHGGLSNLQLLAGALRTSFSLLVLIGVLDLIRQGFENLDALMAYVAAFVISATLVSVFSVAISASWARYAREELLARSLPLLNALMRLFYPLVVLLQLTDPVVRRIVGADQNGNGDSDISEEVLTVVEDHDEGDRVDDEQKEMLEAVFELPNTDVAEIMTPRTDIEGIAVDATLDEVKQAAIEMGHSRIPVFEKDLDHIAGILYVKDLIPFIESNQPFELRQQLRDPFLVPESKSVRDLLAEFKSQQVHMAIVIDEYGGTAGLITIEDILEEIVGEIHDEYEQDKTPEPIRQITSDTAEVDARVYIDELNDHFDVKLPEDEDYDTVGGFVVATLGHIPAEGESFEASDLRFTVTSAERTKVLQLQVVRLAPAES